MLSCFRPPNSRLPPDTGKSSVNLDHSTEAPVNPLPSNTSRTAPTGSSSGVATGTPPAPLTPEQKTPSSRTDYTSSSQSKQSGGISMHGFVDNGSSEAGIRLEMEKEVLLSKLVEQKDAELNRATIQMESYKQQLELERQIKAVEIDLARERQGNMAAMVGLALVHRNQLEAQAAKALTMHALKEAARVEREANEKRQQLLVSTAWWLEAKVDELKEEFSAERKRMEGEIRVLHSNLQALQIDHTEVLVEKAMVEAVLTMTRKGKQELQDQILREEHQHSQRIFELSRTVESLATGAAEANRVAIERELSNEALQSLKAQIGHLEIAKGEAEARAIRTEASLARLTGEDAALSVASGKVIDAAERKAAWDSVGSIGEPGKGENPASLKDIENIKVWMQKLEEQYVASEVLQQQTAGRNEHLEAQIEQLEENLKSFISNRDVRVTALEEELKQARSCLIEIEQGYEELEQDYHDMERLLSDEARQKVLQSLMAAGRAAPSYVASNGISIRGSHDGLNEEATEATASAENDIDWESSEGSDEDDAGICQAPTPPRKPPVLMPRLALGDLTATRSPSKHKDSVEPHIKTEAGAGSSQNDGWQSMRTPRLGARGALASARDGSVSARSPLVQGPPSARSRELDSTAPWMAPQDTFYTPRGSAAWSSASKPSTVHATPRAMTARSSVAGMCSDLERQAHEARAEALDATLKQIQLAEKALAAKDKEIAELKREAQDSAHLEAQVEQLEQILKLVLADKDQRVNDLKDELSLVCTWANEIEKEYNLLEQDYQLLEGHLSDEARAKVKEALQAAGRSAASTEAKREDLPAALEAIPEGAEEDHYGDHKPRSIKVKRMDPSDGDSSCGSSDINSDDDLGVVEAVLEQKPPSPAARSMPKLQLGFLGGQNKAEASPRTQNVREWMRTPRSVRSSMEKPAGAVLLSGGGGVEALSMLQQPKSFKPTDHETNMVPTPARGRCQPRDCSSANGTPQKAAITPRASSLNATPREIAFQQDVQRRARESLASRLNVAMARITEAEGALAEKELEIKQLKTGLTPR